MYYFNLRQSASPTYFNLHQYLQEQKWRSTRFNWRAHFSEDNFQFNKEAAEQLEFKHLFAELAQKYCKENTPLTYRINDDNWLDVLQNLHAKQKKLIWILKPALLNNGQQIKIFQNLDELELHYSTNNRLGGEHVLQEYLLHSHLLKEHKYSIRLFVVLTNDAGIYLYHHGYFNVAKQPYSINNFKLLDSHITNEHLHEHEANVIQIPTDRFDFFPEIYQQIKIILNKLMQGLQQMHAPAFQKEKRRKLAIFGFDFLMDENKKVWLIEANHGPCFPVGDHHPLQEYLYYDFWQAFIKSFVLPIAKKQKPSEITYYSFERIGEK